MNSGQLSMRCCIFVFVCCLVFLHTTTSFAFDVHRFKVIKERFSIYPANIAQVKRQQHAVLYQLVNQVNHSSPEIIAEFARVALSEMALLYEAEARRLRIGGLHLAEGASISRWQMETAEYAHQLYETAAKITGESMVEISIEETGELHLSIEGEPFILGGPVLQDNLLLDRQIIETFCRLNYCDGVWQEKETLDLNRTITIQSDWIIAESKSPEFVTTDGLHFVFDNLENRKKKQRICLNVSKELKTLEETLKEAVQAGLYIDWESLSIKPLYGSYDYRIVINPFGDSVYMQFQTLHAIKNWPEKVADWLQGRIRDGTAQYYFEHDDLVRLGIQ